MKVMIRLLIIIIVFQNLIFAQTASSTSLKETFIKIYKDVIDNKITDEGMDLVVDSLFNTPLAPGENILERIENYLRQKAYVKEKFYTVVEGDCLWSIAQKETGDPYNWNKIFEVNDTLIQNPDLIYPGMQIRILTVSKSVNPDSIASRVLAALVMPKEENPPAKQEEPNYDNLEVENFIVDETISKIGKDFYDLFYIRWNEQVKGGSYSIVISEKALPQRGTQINIKVNDTDVYQSFVQPRYDVIEQSVDQGIYMVFNYLQNYQATQEELKGDMQGTGIY